MVISAMEKRVTGKVIEHAEKSFLHSVSWSGKLSLRGTLSRSQKKEMRKKELRGLGKEQHSRY